MTPRLADTPVLETDRLILRAVAGQDIALGAAFLGSDRSRYMGGPYDRFEAWVHACHQIGHWAARGFGPFAICRKGTDAAMGEAGPFYPDAWPEPELGWSLWTPEAEGKGYAFEAAKAARRHAYGTLGWTTAVSYIDPDNTRSIALAERLGCSLDPNAPLPDLPDWDGTLVYRHPAPAEVLS